MKHDMANLAQDMTRVRLYNIGSDKKPPIVLEYGGLEYIIPPLGQAWAKQLVLKEVDVGDTGKKIKLKTPTWVPRGQAKDPKTGQPYPQCTQNWADIPLAAVKSWYETGKERIKFFDVEYNGLQPELDEDGRAKQVLVTERQAHEAKVATSNSIDDEIREKQAALAALDLQIKTAKAARNPPASPNT